MTKHCTVRPALRGGNDPTGSEGAQASVFGRDGPAWCRSHQRRDILYEPTQAIGDAAYFLGFDSIIAPNARWLCNKLILFTDQIAPDDVEVIESSEVNWTEWRKKLK